MFSQPSPTGVIASIVAWAEPWRAAFNHSLIVSTGVLFAHLAALIGAGGFSLVADQFTLRARSSTTPVDPQLVANTRRFATRMLVLVFASGLALFLSDVASYVELPTFWAKMGLVALLVTNGLLADRTERRLCTNAAPDDPIHTRRRIHALASVSLWLLALCAGTALVNG